MKKLLVTAVFLIAAAFIFIQIRNTDDIKEEISIKPQKIEASRKISGIIKKGETFFEVFKRCGLNITELFKIREAAADVHHLKKVQPGQAYSITVDADNRINSFSYWIGDDGVLEVTREDHGFKAERIPIAYEKKIEHISGVIKDNLISSIGEGRENLVLALQLSDIFAWDIDFTSDLREDDTYKIIVEGLYLDGKLKKFGNILSAEFKNNDKTYYAYRFENNGKACYYDAEGKSLAKAFLKAPLDFRRISSHYSGSRFHPILKVYKPHHGIDYSAPSGTPVSALGDGKVIFAGYNGGYGNLVILRHNNGYETYYGHLQEISRNISAGRTADQGQVIGRVGTTGRSTGPHLHFELRINNEPVNPLSVKLPSGDPLPQQLMASFRLFRDQMDTRLASITTPVYAFKEQSQL